MKNNKKGFTLAELLVVVAIIAVLVAIAIPVFSASLEKSRDAVSVANMRTAYAEAQIAYLAGDSGNATVNTTNKTVTVTGVVIKSEKADNWSSLDADLPFTAPTDPGTAGTKTLVFTYADMTSGTISSVAFGS